MSHGFSGSLKRPVTIWGWWLADTFKPSKPCAQSARFSESVMRTPLAAAAPCKMSVNAKKWTKRNRMHTPSKHQPRELSTHYRVCLANEAEHLDLLALARGQTVGVALAAGSVCPHLHAQFCCKHWEGTMPSFLRNLAAGLTLSLVITAISGGAGFALAAERHIVVTAVEPKGGANVAKEPFPATPLPEGGGYELKKPDDTGRWEVSVYVFDPRQIHVDEGDEVTLEFVGVNGASHPITIDGYAKSFELKRGQSTRVSFTADKAGVFAIVCAKHHPTMVAELIVAAKK